MFNTWQCIGVNTCYSVCYTISRPCIGRIIRYRHILCCIWDFWQYSQIQIYEAIAIGNYRFQRHWILASLIVLATIPCQRITVAEDHSIRSWSDRIMNIQIQCHYAITTICIIERHGVSNELISSSVLLIIPNIGVSITNCLVIHRRLNLVTNDKIQFLDHAIAAILIRNNMHILFLYRAYLTIPSECLTMTDCFYLNRLLYRLRMNLQVQDMDHTITLSTSKWHAYGV